MSMGKSDFDYIGAECCDARFGPKVDGFIRDGVRTIFVKVVEFFFTGVKGPNGFQHQVSPNDGGLIGHVG